MAAAMRSGSPRRPKRPSNAHASPSWPIVSATPLRVSFVTPAPVITWSHVAAVVVVATRTVPSRAPRPDKPGLPDSRGAGVAGAGEAGAPAAVGATPTKVGPEIQGLRLFW